MSPSGLEYKLDKMANSLALGSTLRLQTSRAEVPLGSDAPGEKNALEHTRSSTYVSLRDTPTHACKRAHTPEGAHAALTGRVGQFLLFSVSPCKSTSD